MIAECTINEVIQRLMRVDTQTLFRARQISTAGSIMAGSAYNGPHAANGITAVFIATGQDVANVAANRAGITYAQLLDNGDYYWSVTLPSLIVASYGGGTGLPTLCANASDIGCYGQGKADQLAEIVGAVVLAGDVSLGSAVLAGDWVSSHDRLGQPTLTRSRRFPYPGTHVERPHADPEPGRRSATLQVGTANTSRFRCRNWPARSARRRSAPVTRVPPGKAAIPIHHHHANEEHFRAERARNAAHGEPHVSGQATRLHRQPSRRPRVAHQLVNTGTGPGLPRHFDAGAAGGRGPLRQDRRAPRGQEPGTVPVNDGDKTQVGYWDGEDGRHVRAVLGER